MEKTIALLTSMAALVGAGTASAQSGTRYYARQTLVRTDASPTPSTAPYVADYGAYGGCSNKVRTASIASCTQDGKTVSLSMCADQPQTKTVGCFTCTMSINRTGGNYSGYNTGTASTLEEAVSKCEALRNSQGTAGICWWSGTKFNTAGDTPGNLTKTSVTYTSLTERYGGRCEATM